jgi:hypothetical protein
MTYLDVFPLHVAMSGQTDEEMYPSQEAGLWFSQKET